MTLTYINLFCRHISILSQITLGFFHCIAFLNLLVFSKCACRLVFTYNYVWLCVVCFAVSAYDNNNNVWQKCCWNGMLSKYFTFPPCLTNVSALPEETWPRYCASVVGMWYSILQFINVVPLRIEGWVGLCVCGGDVVLNPAVYQRGSTEDRRLNGPVCVVGMWYSILQFINLVGVVTNACLIAFTSSWGNSHSITGQLLIVIVFEVPHTHARTDNRETYCLRSTHTPV